MIYILFHWYCGEIKKQVPEAFEHLFKNTDGVENLHWAARIDDLREFAEKHGNIIVNRPTKTFPHWYIFITDSTGQFRQK